MLRVLSSRLDVESLAEPTEPETGIGRWGQAIRGYVPEEYIGGGLVHRDGRLYASSNAQGGAVRFDDGTRLPAAAAYIAAFDDADGSLAWAIQWEHLVPGAVLQPQDMAASPSGLVLVGRFDTPYDFGGPTVLETADWSAFVVGYDL